MFCLLFCNMNRGAGSVVKWLSTISDGQRCSASQLPFSSFLSCLVLHFYSKHWPVRHFFRQKIGGACFYLGTISPKVGGALAPFVLRLPHP